MWLGNKIMIDQKALDEVFPNNPIQEVAFEIRFPHNLRVNRDICELQESLAQDYTDLSFGEESSPTETVFTYHLISKRLGRTIKVSENRFAIILNKYTSFELFTQEVLKHTQQVCEIFRIKQITRAGLRYVNNIHIPNIGGSFPLEKFVKPYIDFERLSSAQAKQFAVEMLLNKEDCLFLVRSAFLTQTPIANAGFYILDLDAFFEGKVEYSNLFQVLSNLHLQIQVEFLNHITEDYKQQMRGAK